MSASALSRGLAAIAPLVTVPVSLRFLGVSGYGAWSAALAVTAFASFADLGIGAGLMTKLAAALAVDDFQRARRLVSSAYIALGALIAVVIGLLWASSGVIDWAGVVGGSHLHGNRQVGLIALITLSGFFTNAVVMLIVRVQYAAQQVALSNLWQAGGSLLGIGAIYLAAAVTSSSSAFVAFAAFTPALVAAVNSILFFWNGKGRRFRPRLRWFKALETRELAGIGAKFLVINVLMTVSLSTDSWIVAHTSSLAAVTQYSIPARVFGVIGTAVSVLSIPLWPANSEAINRGDMAWVRRTMRRMSIITPLFVAILSVAAIVLAPMALRWWLGGSVQPSLVLLIGLGAWSLAQAFVAPMFMVQNAAGVLRAQIIGYAVLLVALPIKWFVSSQFGYEWLPLTSTLCYAAIIWPAAWIGYRGSIKHLLGARPKDGTLLVSQ